MDLRNKETCPCFKNLAQWDSARLKETLIEAYQNQMEVLKEHEGDDNHLYRSLQHDLSKIRKVNTDQADRDARKLKL